MKTILSRAFRGVEAFGLASILTVGANAAEPRYPEPKPQLDLPAHSTWAEARGLITHRKWAEAAIVLRTLLKVEGRNGLGEVERSQAAMELARALLYSGRREEALVALNQGMKTSAERESRVRTVSRAFLRNPTFQLYQDGLNLLTGGKYRPGREKLERALEQEPDNVEILVRIGQALALDGDFDSAAEKLRLARRLNPYEPEIRLWLGRALHQRGELDQAIVELRGAYEELDGSERAPLWYAEALLSRGQRRAAVELLERETQEQSEHVHALLFLAKTRVDDPWSSRKDLQLALSRLDTVRRSESELGLELGGTPEAMKQEVVAALSQIETQIQAPKPGSSANRREH